MGNTRLTDRFVRNAKTAKGQEDFVDQDFVRGGSFVFRVYLSGEKSFHLLYRINGRRRRYLIGSYPVISLADARAEALSLLRKVKMQIDPASERKKRLQADTVNDLFWEVYLPVKQAQIANSTANDFKSMWNREIQKTVGHIKAADLRKRDVIPVLESLAVVRGKQTMSNRLRELLNAVLNHAVARDILDFNPIAGLPRFGKERFGERFLNEKEIRKYWKCSEGLTVTERVHLRLLLLLALRPGEARKLRWDWLDGDMLTIPGSEVKNGRTHQLPITQMVATEIEFLRSVTGSEEHLFPGPIAGTHRPNFRTTHTQLLGLMKCPPWTLRDIRRTCETQMRRIVSDGEAVARVLNHDVSRIRKHYDKGDYLDRKRGALLRWGNWIEGLVSGQQRKVVNIR